MTDETDDAVKVVLSGAVQGPPLGIDVHEIIERGGRIRRRRKRLAVVGSSAATVVAVVAVTAVALGLGRSPTGPNPIEPAGPGLTTESVTPPPTSKPVTVPDPSQRGVTPTARPTTPAIPTTSRTVQRPPASAPLGTGTTYPTRTSTTTTAPQPPTAALESPK